MKDTREAKRTYLDKHIFYGLENLNTGFDVPSIKYFSQDDFEIVLKRVQKLGFGIYGIEPWKNGFYFDVRVWSEWKKWGVEDCRNPFWYWEAFEGFKMTGERLQYAASYELPIAEMSVMGPKNDFKGPGIDFLS